jgi:hypothetical protein
VADQRAPQAGLQSGPSVGACQNRRRRARRRPPVLPGRGGAEGSTLAAFTPAPDTASRTVSDTLFRDAWCRQVTAELSDK